MKLRHAILPGAALTALTACSVNPNSTLMFGDNAHIGLHLGSDVAAGGASVNLGYKHRSVAVVPVSVLQGDGKAESIRADNSAAKDALSVFAVFESSAEQGEAKQKGEVGIGQIFSTGAAAQAITEGYQCRAEGRETCEPRRLRAQKPSSERAPDSASIPKDDPDKDKAEKSAQTTPSPFQIPLVYARTDIFGLDIGGSVVGEGVAQEAVFSLGYSSRNLALIPVYQVSADKKVSALYSLNDKRNSHDGRDALSVLGQFQSQNSISGATYGFQRFFATGVAASNLADGIKATVARGKPRGDTQPAATSPAASTASSPSTP